LHLLLLIFAFLLFALIAWLLCFAPGVIALFTKAALFLLALAGVSVGATLSAVVSPIVRLSPAGIDTIFIIRYSPFKYFKFHRKFELANVSVDRANGQIRLGFFFGF